MPLMWWVAVAPTAKRRAEMARMVTEMNAAMLDGMIAANFHASREAFDFWSKAMTGRLGHDAGPQAMGRIAAAAAAPAAKRVKANRSRLRRWSGV
jgi:hypothetical protein